MKHFMYVHARAIVIKNVHNFKEISTQTNSTAQLLQFCHFKNRVLVMHNKEISFSAVWRHNVKFRVKSRGKD